MRPRPRLRFSFVCLRWSKRDGKKFHICEKYLSYVKNGTLLQMPESVNRHQASGSAVRAAREKSGSRLAAVALWRRPRRLQDVGLPRGALQPATEHPQPGSGRRSRVRSVRDLAHAVPTARSPQRCPLRGRNGKSMAGSSGNRWTPWSKPSMVWIGRDCLAR